MHIRLLFATADEATRALLHSLLDSAIQLSCPPVVRMEVATRPALLERAKASLDDVILLDWALPGLNSLEMRHHLITAVRGLYPCVSLVVLWGSGVDHLPRGLPGVDAWVSKAEPPQQLRATLHAIWPTPGGRQHRHALGSVFIPRQ